MGTPGDIFSVVRRLESGGQTGINSIVGMGGTGIGPTGAPLDAPSSAPTPFDAVLTTYMALIWRDCLSSLEHDLANGPQAQAQAQTQTASEPRMIPLSTMLGLAMTQAPQAFNPLAFPPNAHVSMMTPPAGVGPNEALRLADAMAVMEAKMASSSTKKESEDDDKHPSVGRLTQGQR